MRNLYFNVTYKCNCSCIFCAADIPLGFKGEDDITKDEMKDIIQKYEITQEDHVILNGGEPTLNNELEGLIRELNKTGCRITIFTNGIRLNDFEYCQSLVEAGVDCFSIPFYTPVPEQYQNLTKNDGLPSIQNAVHHIEQLMEAHDVEYELKVLIMKQNEKNFIETYLHLNQEYKKFKRILISGLIVSESIKENNAQFSYEAIKDDLNTLVEHSLKNNVPIIIESIPLCILKKDNIVKYTISRMSKNKVQLSELNSLYYNKSNASFEVDAFNSNISSCIHTDCLLYLKCRLNPMHQSVESDLNIKPIKRIG